MVYLIMEDIEADQRRRERERKRQHGSALLDSSDDQQEQQQQQQQDPRHARRSTPARNKQRPLACRSLARWPWASSFPPSESTTCETTSTLDTMARCCRGTSSPRTGTSSSRYSRCEQSVLRQRRRASLMLSPFVPSARWYAPNLITLSVSAAWLA
jgi:hypothetical protein